MNVPYCPVSGTHLCRTSILSHESDGMNTLNNDMNSLRIRISLTKAKISCQVLEKFFGPFHCATPKLPPYSSPSPTNSSPQHDKNRELFWPRRVPPVSESLALPPNETPYPFRSYNVWSPLTHSHDLSPALSIPLINQRNHLFDHFVLLLCDPILDP